MAIQVDTGKVLLCADNITKHNDQINSDFSRLRNELRKLDSAWSGTASQRAEATFDRIDKTFCDARYGVVNNFSHFLRRQVGDSYDTLEHSVSTAANAFK